MKPSEGFALTRPTGVLGSVQTQMFDSVITTHE